MYKEFSIRKIAFTAFILILCLGVLGVFALLVPVPATSTSKRNSSAGVAADVIIDGSEEVNIKVIGTKGDKGDPFETLFEDFKAGCVQY